MTDVPVTKTRKISIITPSMNRVEMLKSAVQSVVAQGYPDYEHIIVDGGSTDGTSEFVKTQPQIKFLCEPDRGMYDALNKGLSLASGEVIGFLNTDDLYAEGVFPAVMVMFADDDVLAVACKADVFFEGAEEKPWIKLHYSPEEQNLLESSTICGNYFNAWFFRDTVFRRVGAFDPAYKIVGDRDFMLRIALAELPYKTLDKVAYLYRSHPGSLTFDRADEKQKLRVDELYEMSTHYLKYEELTSKEKRLIARLHTQACLALARWSERAGDMAGYRALLAECIRYDPYAIPRVMRFMLRSAITRSIKRLFTFA